MPPDFTMAQLKSITISKMLNSDKQNYVFQFVLSSFLRFFKRCFFDLTHLILIWLIFCFDVMVISKVVLHDKIGYALEQEIVKTFNFIVQPKCI